MIILQMGNVLLIWFLQKAIPKHLCRERDARSHLVVLMHPLFRRIHLSGPSPGWRCPVGSRFTLLALNMVQVVDSSEESVPIRCAEGS